MDVGSVQEFATHMIGRPSPPRNGLDVADCLSVDASRAPVVARRHASTRIRLSGQSESTI
jgi:hypothetical protein